MNAIITDTILDPTVGITTILAGKNTPRNGTRPIVIYHHGFTQDGWTPVAGPLYGQYSQVINLVNMGYIVASSDFGNNAGAAAQLWGNNTDLARMADVMEYTASWAGYTAAANGVVGGTTFRGGYLNTGKKFILMGTSMGGLASLNFAATYPLYVSAIIGFIPVVDLYDIWLQTTPLVYGPYIDSAYPPGYDDSIMGNQYNPKRKALLNQYANMPILIVGGSADTVASPATHATFKTNVDGTSAGAANVTLAVVSGTGHDEDTPNNYPKAYVTDWLQKYQPVV